MGAHIDKDGKFQSDKYPTCPADKVPLSVNDPVAQPKLWDYADEHRVIDHEFSEDLQRRLLQVGYEPPASTLECDHCGGVAIEADADDLFTDGMGEECETCGFPGHVSVCGDDEDPGENPVYWKVSEEVDARCADHRCEECLPIRDMALNSYVSERRIRAMYLGFVAGLAAFAVVRLLIVALVSR